jgi:hypothetical protein
MLNPITTNQKTISPITKQNDNPMKQMIAS